MSLYYMYTTPDRNYHYWSEWLVSAWFVVISIETVQLYCGILQQSLENIGIDTEFILKLCIWYHHDPHMILTFDLESNYWGFWQVSLSGPELFDLIVLWYLTCGYITRQCAAYHHDPHMILLLLGVLASKLVWARTFFFKGVCLYIYSVSKVIIKLDFFFCYR